MKRKLLIKLTALSKTIAISSAFVFFTFCSDWEHKKKSYYKQNVDVGSSEFSFNKGGSKEFFRESLSKEVKKGRNFLGSLVSTKMAYGMKDSVVIDLDSKKEYAIADIQTNKVYTLRINPPGERKSYFSDPFILIMSDFDYPRENPRIVSEEDTLLCDIKVITHLDATFNSSEVGLDPLKERFNEKVDFLKSIGSKSMEINFNLYEILEKSIDVTINGFKKDIGSEIIKKARLIAKKKATDIAYNIKGFIYKSFQNVNNLQIQLIKHIHNDIERSYGNRQVDFPEFAKDKPIPNSPYVNKVPSKHWYEYTPGYYIGHELIYNSIKKIDHLINGPSKEEDKKKFKKILEDVFSSILETQMSPDILKKNDDLEESRTDAINKISSKLKSSATYSSKIQALTLKLKSIKDKRANYLKIKQLNSRLKSIQGKWSDSSKRLENLLILNLVMLSLEKGKLDIYDELRIKNSNRRSLLTTQANALIDKNHFEEIVAVSGIGISITLAMATMGTNLAIIEGEVGIELGVEAGEGEVGEVGEGGGVEGGEGNNSDTDTEPEGEGENDNDEDFNQQQIEALDQQIEALDQQIEALDQQIEALDQKNAFLEQQVTVQHVQLLQQQHALLLQPLPPPSPARR